MKRLLCFVMVFSWACNGPSSSGDGLEPADACHELAAMRCAKYFECYDAEARAAIGLPATEAECVTATVAELDCDGQTAALACGEGKTYDPGKAKACAAEYRALSCEAVLDGPDETDTPSCAQTCQ